MIQRKTAIERSQNTALMENLIDYFIDKGIFVRTPFAREDHIFLSLCMFERECVCLCVSVFVCVSFLCLFVCACVCTRVCVRERERERECVQEERGRERMAK